MKDKTWTLIIPGKQVQGFIVGILFTLVILGGVSGCYQGRKISRITGGAVNIDLPEDVTSYEQIVSISFHKNSDGETIKDVTYMGSDGKLHSKEYNDWGVFQGEIIWNLQNEG
ncbi:MAG: hypothetical protein AAF629_10740 [Chloroflexota bacterium]